MKDLLIFQFVPHLLSLWCDVCVRERGREKERDFFLHLTCTEETLLLFVLPQSPSWPDFLIAVSLQASKLESNFCHLVEFVLRFWENIFVKKTYKTTSKNAEKHRICPSRMSWVLIILHHLVFVPQSLNGGRRKIDSSTGQSCCERHLHWWKALFVVQKPRILVALWGMGVWSSQQCSSSFPCGKRVRQCHISIPSPLLAASSGLFCCSHTIQNTHGCSKKALYTT